MAGSNQALLISKVLDEADLNQVRNRGLKPYHLSGDYKDAYEWILDYQLSHQAVPTHRAFSRAFGHLNLPDATGETFSGLIEEVVNEYKFTTLQTALGAQKKLTPETADEVMGELSEGISKARVEAAQIRDVDLVSTWEERYKRYEELHESMGIVEGAIKTGRSGFDMITGGFRPQQFIVMAGEPKRGKSLVSLLLANAIHSQHLGSTLFLSFEMSADEQAARYDAFRAGISHSKLLDGSLTRQDLKKLQAAKFYNDDAFLVSEDTARLTTVSAIAQKVKEFQPDVLFIDGMYMLEDDKGEPSGSPQALTNITRATKRLAQEADICIFGTTQVLPSKIQNAKTRAITADSLGYSSSWAQDADLVLGIERDPDQQDTSIIRVVLGRTVAADKTVHIKWDWDTMDFDEVEAPTDWNMWSNEQFSEDPWG